MKKKKVCPVCSKVSVLEVDGETLARFERREEHIQFLFPTMHPVDREFLITGFCKKCQENFFGKNTAIDFDPIKLEYIDG